MSVVDPVNERMKQQIDTLIILILLLDFTVTFLNSDNIIVRLLFKTGIIIKNTNKGNNYKQ